MQHCFSCIPTAVHKWPTCACELQGHGACETVPGRPGSLMSQSGQPARACCTTMTAHASHPTPMILPSRCLAPLALIPLPKHIAAASGPRHAKQSARPKLQDAAKRGDGDDDAKIRSRHVAELMQFVWISKPGWLGIFNCRRWS